MAAVKGEFNQLSTRRILFLVSSMEAGGAERVAALLSNYWVEQGNHVTLMPTFSGHGECKYFLDNRVRIDYLADHVNTTRKTPRNMLRRFFALRHTISAGKFDVVLAFLTHVNVAAILASRGLGVPVVVSERIYPPSMPLSLVWKLMRRITYPRAHRVVAQTADTARWLSRFCSPESLRVIYNPVVLPIPVGEPILDPRCWMNSNQRTLLSAGRLDAQKQFDVLIDAFGSLAVDFPEWNLIILGEGQERTTLQAQIDRLGLNSRIHLPGRAGNVAQWYESADIFALTSSFEGFPNALLEAMAYKLPVISFDCKVGPRDIIRHEVDGLLIDPGLGSEGFSQGLSKLMGDVALREQMGRSARDVIARFSMQKIGESWQEAFD